MAAKLSEPSLKIRFTDLGRETSNVKSYTLDSAYMTSTDAFSFVLYEKDVNLVRGLELQPVELYVDGNLQAVGRVEVTTVGGTDGLAIQCQGRDYICDMVECNVDPAVSINDKMKLEQAVKLAAKAVGVTDVTYDAARWRNQRAGGQIQTPVPQWSFQEAPLKDYKVNPGEGIYEFLARMCVRFGATIQPTLQRDTVLLSAPDYVQEAAYSITRSFSNPGSTKNNVLNATATRDYTKFPTVVLVSGKASGGPGQTRKAAATTSSSGEIMQRFTPSTVWEPWYPFMRFPEEDDINIYQVSGSDEQQENNFFSGYFQETEEKVAAETRATTVDSDIQKTIWSLLPPGVAAWTRRIPPKSPRLPVALYRLLYLRDTLAKDTKQLANTTARIAAERMKDSLQYEVTIRGHKDPETGRTYTPDTIIDVNDDICGIGERLWVEHVEFSYAQGAGPITKLTCWRPGSFGIGADK